MQRQTWVLALVVAMALAPVSAQQARKTAMPEFDGLIEMMSTGASKTITFSDEKGHPISKAQFLAGLKKTGSFSHNRDEVHHSTAFKLMPAGKEIDVKTTAGSSLEQALHIHYKIKPGQPFPSFELTDVRGKAVSNASLRGTPTVVNFFFADCIGCIAETPTLNAYAKAHPQVHVLAVTYDDAKTARQYMSQRHFAWPIAYAGQHLIDALGVTAYPTIALIGANGRLLDIRLSGSIQTGGDTITAKDMDRWVMRTLASGGAARLKN